MLTGKDFTDAKFVQFQVKQPIRTEQGKFGTDYIYSIQCEGESELKASQTLHDKLQDALKHTTSLSMHLAQFTNEEGQKRKAWNINSANPDAVQNTPQAVHNAPGSMSQSESINRAVALKAAVEYKGRIPEAEGAVLDMADRFLQWLNGK